MRRDLCRLSIIFGLFIFFSNIGCSTKNRYAQTNKIYTQRSKEVADSLTVSLPGPHIPEISDPEIIKVAVPDKSVNLEDKAYDLQKKGMRKDYDWVGAVHFDIRKPNFVIIHHTAQESIEQTIHTFTVPHTKVSAHYLIGKNGEIYQMLNDYLRGWHAGKSKWGNITDMNSVSLGIELDNNGKEPFPEAQITSLLNLLDTLKTSYQIPQANFLGHADIAPGRKNDPSVFFPWKRLADHGFGLWYNESYLITPPDNFNALDALRLIGYDVSNPKAAIRVFKQKFIVNDLSDELTLYDKSVLYNLYQRYF